MAEPTLATIDFVLHGKVTVAAHPDRVWPHIVDVSSWRSGGQHLKLISGQLESVGARFAAVATEALDTPLYHVENSEMIPGERRTIRLEELDGSFMGFASWSLTPQVEGTVVAYDVYCRGPMLPPGMSQGEVLRSQQLRVQEGLLVLKAFIEG